MVLKERIKIIQYGFNPAGRAGCAEVKIELQWIVLTKKEKKYQDQDQCDDPEGNKKPFFLAAIANLSLQAAFRARHNLQV